MAAQDLERCPRCGATVLVVPASAAMTGAEPATGQLVRLDPDPTPVYVPRDTVDGKVYSLQVGRRRHACTGKMKSPSASKLSRPPGSG